MRKKRETISFLSNNSRKILERGQSNTEGCLSRNSGTPNKINFSKINGHIPTTPQSNLQVHNRLYDDSSARKLKKTILANKYRNQYWHNRSKFIVDLSVNDLETKNLLRTGRVSMLNLGAKSPDDHSSRYSQMKILTDRKSHNRMSDLKNTRKRSSLKASQRLYHDAVVRRKSKEKIKFFIASPKENFKTNKSSVYLIEQFLQDFNEAFSNCENESLSRNIDFTKTFEIMMKWGFIRPDLKLAQTEINYCRNILLNPKNY